MNSFMEKDTFGFGDESNVEQNTNNYETISGLGQSDYENEDLFNTEVLNEEQLPTYQEVASNYYNSMYNIDIPMEYQTAEFYEQNLEPENNLYVDDMKEQQFDSLKVFNPDNLYVEDNVESSSEVLEEENDDKQTKEENVEEQQILENKDTETEETIVEPVVEETVTPIAEEPIEAFENNIIEEQETKEEMEIPVKVEEIYNEQKDNTDKNVLSTTSMEELNKLTEYEEEKIETTDIKALFDRVGVNVKEASDIFKKNSEMKEKIDSRFEELKKLQSEVEKSKKSQYDEINAYKEEVLGKLTEKKDEIEKRLNKLKEFQAKLEKEKEEFEVYKKSEKAEIERVQKEIQEAYDGRREELSHIEDVLRKQKDALDEERSQLSLDRIQYESDKNELANNLLKFNEIVDSFTNGMDKLNKEEE